MRKCKLGDLFEIKQGYAFKSEKYQSAGKYVLCTLGNISADNNFKYDLSKANYYPDDFSHTFILEEGDLIIPLTEQAVGLFGNTAFIPLTNGFQFVLNQRVGKVIPKKAVADKYYLHYLLSTELVRNQIEATATGTSQRNTSPEKIYDVTVWVPDIEQQRKIGKTLFDLERKVNINKLINDNLEQQMRLIFENMMAKAATHKLSGEYTIAQNLATVVTGKEDANFSVPNGKYKFFTCSNTPLLCDEYVFDSSSVLIAGNGDFNVKHYSGKFNAYQRTYVLTPDKKYFGLLYLASLYRINSFKSRSSGSIVKFITKSDVENIPVFIPNDMFYLQELNKLIYLQEQNKLENELLVNLRDWLLPMLMNGQATVSD